MERPLIFASGNNDPFETQRRRRRVTLLPSLRDDQRGGLLPATVGWERPSDPAIGANAATGDAGQLPSRQPLLAIVDDQFGMLSAADEETR